MTTYKQRLDELVKLRDAAKADLLIPNMASNDERAAINAEHYKVKMDWLMSRDTCFQLAEELHAEVERQKETVRCMSKVFDDLAHELGVPKEKHGDPDLLFDAIDTLRTAADKIKEAINDFLCADSDSDEGNAIIGMHAALSTYEQARGE